MKRQSLILIVLLAFGMTSLQAQDPIFSQFYAAPLQINPAFTGTTYTPNISMIYRNQWPTLNAYQTYSVSFDQFFEPMNSGIGLMVTTDDAGQGLIKLSRISGFYSYKVAVNRELSLKFGVEATYAQVRLNWDELVFFDQIDQIYGYFDAAGNENTSEEIQPDNLTKSYLDMSAGILAYSKQFYFGISMKHLNTPDESFIPVNQNLNVGLPMRFTLHGGAEFVLRKGNKRRQGSFLSPNAMFVKQGDFGQLNLGTYANLGMVFGGVWYRHAFTNPDAAIFLVGLQKGNYKFGYSYDLTISRLSGNTAGSHEVSIRINFDKERGPDYTDCFKMFR